MFVIFQLIDAIVWIRVSIVNIIYNEYKRFVVGNLCCQIQVLQWLSLYRWYGFTFNCACVFSYLTSDSVSTIGKSLLPEKPTGRCRETKTAVKFGFKYSKDVMKINKKKRDISCEKANGLDIRNIICILKSQCKHEATNISVDIATECREIIDRVKMKLNFQTLSRWVTDLVECLVLAYGFEFEPSEATEELIQIVLDSIHLLIGKNKTTRFTDQLLAIFIELASEAHPKEKAKVARSLIESTSPFELSRPFFKSQVLANCFCVCQGKILQQLLTLVHVYVTTYDSERIKCARSTILASILYFDHHEVLEIFNSLSW